MSVDLNRRQLQVFRDMLKKIWATENLATRKYRIEELMIRLDNWITETIGSEK